MPAPTDSRASAALLEHSARGAEALGVQALLGVDGGGSGTRARLQSPQGRTLGLGLAGPSALAHGVEQSWRHVQQAVDAAFTDAALPRPPLSALAIGLGLSGAEIDDWHAAFVAANPGYALCLLRNDALTQLAGAHGGRPGVVLAAGTGAVAACSAGECDEAGQAPRRAGGWGFPVGDEGGGAWIGLHAVQHLQRSLDGRAAPDDLSRALAEVVGRDAAAVLGWCAQAGQHAYAQLAPRVFATAEGGCASAGDLLDEAAVELEQLARAMLGDSALTLVVSGSVGSRLWQRWTPALRARVVPAEGDSADGALLLLREALSAARVTRLPAGGRSP